MILILIILLFLLICVCYARVEEQNNITDELFKEIQVSLDEIKDTLKG